jgi:hypothetical protein
VQKEAIMDRRYLALGLFAVLAVPSAALADFSGPLSSGSFEATMNMGPIAQNLNHNVAGQAPTVRNNDATAPFSFAYNASPTRTRANLQAFVQKTRSVDPAGASQLEQLFASVDVIEEIGSIMANYGLSKNNAADAFAVYWISAWQAANGDASDRSPKTYRAVSAQVAQGFSQSPDFARAGDAQKQQMAEAMLVQAALIDSSKEQMSSDPVQMKALGKAVNQGATKSGLDLDKMTLTENGFVPAKPRKRSDASDVAGEEKALASATPSDGTAEGSSNYALIAGAGGLGLAFLIGKAMGRKA